jgi:two-component sensor histidine kinase
MFRGHKGVKGDGMGKQQSFVGFVPIPRFELKRLWRRAIHECRRKSDDCSVGALRDALAREEILLRRVQSVLEEQEVLRDESDHRILNGLQVVVSTLMMQSRAATPDVALQLSGAAHRVRAIERIHRRLHINDGTQIVEFKKYLEDFCGDFSGIIMPEDDAEQNILVECDEISLPTKVAIPLGFIASELIINAIKYGKGDVSVELKGLVAGCTLTVSNDGPALAEGYDPAASKGLGMKIIRSFVRQIGAELTFGRSDLGRGARFTVQLPRLEMNPTNRYDMDKRGMMDDDRQKAFLARAEYAEKQARRAEDLNLQQQWIKAAEAYRQLAL